MARRAPSWSKQVALWIGRRSWQLIEFGVSGAVLLGVWLFRRQDSVPVGYRSGHPVMSWLGIMGGLVLLTSACCLMSDGTSVRDILLVMVGVGCLYLGIQNTRVVKEENITVSLLTFPVCYIVRVPKSTEWNSTRALQFLEQLLVSFPNLVVQITASHEGLQWQLVDMVHGAQPGTIKQAVLASYPEAEVSVMSRQFSGVVQPFYRYISYYRQATSFVGPLQYVTEIKTVDPLTGIAQIMSQLQTGEQICYLLAIAGNANEAYALGERMVTQSTIHPLQLLSRAGQRDAVIKLATARDRDERYVYRDQKVLEDKLREKLYRAFLLIQIDAPSRHRIVELTTLLDAQLSHFARMPYNELVWIPRSPEHFTRRVESADQEGSTSALSLYRNILSGELNNGPPQLILELRELAALWHLPHEGFRTPHLRWARELVEVPETMAHLTDGIILGTGESQEDQITVRIPLSDRATHLNIIGKTGSGKSTLLHHLIHQDIQERRGVAIIDPHGKLVQDILQISIPSHREQDVVVLDSAQADYPPPLNPLSGFGGYTSTLKVVGLIERLFTGMEGAARMASFLRAALLPLQTDPSATMRDIARMFMDEVYRAQRLAAIDDPEIQDFWDFQYGLGSPALQRQIADPIINRIRPFYANPHLYPVLCHSDTLDFRALIRQKKIILISLAMDEEQVPEQERNLIGALLVSRLQMLVTKDLTQIPFFIYIDEVQKFVTTSLSELFSEARKYGLSLVTANQYLGQLTGKTLEAVLGNVGSTVIFACSPEDASALAVYTKPSFTAQQLTELDRFEAVVKTQIQGRTVPAFSLRTLPPLQLPPDALEREQRIRQYSITAYTPRSRQEVLAWLKDRYPRQRPTSPVGDLSGDEETFYD